jgi:hypothetical protein
METYQLIVTVAIFLGVMSLVLLTEKRRRAEIERTEKLEQAFGQCLQALQGIRAEIVKSTAATEALTASLEKPIKFPAQTKQ